MKKYKFLYIAILGCVSPLVLAKESCMQEVQSEYLGYTKTCYENIGIKQDKFLKLCLDNKLLEVEDETAKVSHKVIGKCPTPYLAACKGGNIPYSNKKSPYNYYYYKNEGLKYIKKGCTANGGNWIAP